MSSISIEWLAQLPLEEQEKVLSRLAKNDDLCPIEINGKKFFVPEEVIFLIDSLWAQLGNTDPFPQSG
tara:strand:- start:4006 stop:4209 length:204 start_codon:yes stop_codon:yes gene_type:complete